MFRFHARTVASIRIRSSHGRHRNCACLGVRATHTMTVLAKETNEGVTVTQRHNNSSAHLVRLTQCRNDTTHVRATVTSDDSGSCGSTPSRSSNGGDGGGRKEEEETSICVLFCDTTFAECRKRVNQLLMEPNEHNLKYQVTCCAQDKIHDYIHKAHVVVPLMSKISANLINSAKTLRLIHQWGVGIEGVDVASATDNGVYVANIPARGSFNDHSTAEHAIFLLLSLLRRQEELRHTFKYQKLGEPVADTIYGSRVAIFGFGALGQQVAIRLKSFGCTIIGIKQTEWPEEDKNCESRVRDGGEHLSLRELVDECHVFTTKEELAKIIETVSVLILCSPLTPKTHHAIDGVVISRCRGLFLVNVARGAIVDYSALCEGLETGRIAGVGLDVFWKEPFDSSDPIVRPDKWNMILTPHVGGHSRIAHQQMSKQMVYNIRRVIEQSIPPVNWQNPF